MDFYSHIRIWYFIISAWCRARNTLVHSFRIDFDVIGNYICNFIKNRMEVSNLIIPLYLEYLIGGTLIGIPIIYFILNIEWEDTDKEKKESNI